MDRKPKARVPKVEPAKATKKKKRAKEKGQRERFIEAARSIGVDETGKEFDAALKRMVPPRTAGRMR